MELKSDKAWGCPCSIKWLLKDIRSALTPSLLPLPLSFFLFVDLELSKQIQMCSTIRRDLPYYTPFPLWWWWISDYGVDYEIMWVIVNSGRGPHIRTLCFSSITVFVWKWICQTLQQLIKRHWTQWFVIKLVPGSLLLLSLKQKIWKST